MKKRKLNSKNPKYQKKKKEKYKRIFVKELDNGAKIYLLYTL
tara:strand:- start:375 stop:500 length:126 start_codon:yes stop_codon:yes gene_type:complete